MEQLIIPKLIFFSILVTYLVDIVLILSGEIQSWSLMGVKGLIIFMYSFCNIIIVVIVIIIIIISFKIWCLL